MTDLENGLAELDARRAKEYESYVARTERALKSQEGEAGDRKARITVIGLFSAAFFTLEAYLLAKNFFPEAVNTIETTISSYFK